MLEVSAVSGDQGGGRGLTNKPVYERLRALADRADAGHKLTRADALLLRHASALIEQREVLMDGANERERKAVGDACSYGAIVSVVLGELRALVEHVERHSKAGGL